VIVSEKGPQSIWKRMDWASDKHADRIESLDLYHGVLVSLMILSNYFSYLKAIPSSFKHASPGAGITIIDFGVPLFFSFSAFLMSYLSKNAWSEGE